MVTSQNENVGKEVGLELGALWIRNHSSNDKPRYRSGLLSHR